MDTFNYKLQMKTFACLILIIPLFLFSSNLFSQELEPRNYASIPKGMNVAALSYSYSFGNLVTDATSPIEDADIKSNTIVLAYVRSLSFFGKLAKLQANLPYTFLKGSAKVNGNDTSITRSGFADARVRFGVNIIGVPALAPKDFVRHQEETVLGASLVIGLPIGQYLTDKVINIGSNRWGFKPEIGFSQRFSSFFFELYTGVWLFTKNDEYLKTNTVTQNPIFTFQAHVDYIFPSKIWIAANCGYADGGETKVNGVDRNDFQANWRSGLTISVPFGMQNSIKLIVNSGVATRFGQKATIFSFAYQYSWF